MTEKERNSSTETRCFSDHEKKGFLYKTVLTSLKASTFTLKNQSLKTVFNNNNWLNPATNKLNHWW